MVKKVLFGVAGALIATVSVPAGAVVTICQGTGQQCAPQTDANILINAATNQNTIMGSFNSGSTNASGIFDSSENLNGDANGQAVISAANGSVLNDLSFVLTNNFTFGVATFNLSATGPAIANEATSVTIFFTRLGGVMGSQTLSIDTNGSNFFGIFGTQGERFTGLSFDGAGDTGVVDFRQLRLGDVSAAVSPVPEPRTWAMMLLGFGAVGFSMRRRRRTDNLLQAA